MAEVSFLPSANTRKRASASRECLSSYDVTFDENGVLAFYEKAEELLNNAGFSPLVNKILVCFCTGLKKIFQWILNTPKE